MHVGQVSNLPHVVGGKARVAMDFNDRKARRQRQRRVEETSQAQVDFGVLGDGATRAPFKPLFVVPVLGGTTNFQNQF